MARRLSAVRPGATQGLRHRRAPRRPPRTRPFSPPPQLLRARARLSLLVRRRHANSPSALNSLENGGKFFSPLFRHVFAAKFPLPHGDNCLLTASRTFVDLSFSRLLAYQHGVAAPA